jgi:hypothetical protein
MHLGLSAFGELTPPGSFPWQLSFDFLLPRDRLRRGVTTSFYLLAARLEACPLGLAWSKRWASDLCVGPRFGSLRIGSEGLTATDTRARWFVSGVLRARTRVHFGGWFLGVDVAGEVPFTRDTFYFLDQNEAVDIYQPAVLNWFSAVGLGVSLP